MKIEIGNLYFLAFIPVLIGFMYYSYKKYRLFSKNDKLIFISRIIIFTLLVLSLANISLMVKGKNISTVFLLDVSESTNAFNSEGKEFINDALRDIPKDNKAGVIVFGDNSKVDKILDEKDEYIAINTTVLIGATNIQEAIESSFGLFEEGSSKRIVLITDGEENQGDMLETIPLINSQNIDFKVYKLNSEESNEIYVDNLKIPDNIAIGEEFTVQINIESNYVTEANLVLFSGRDIVGEQVVNIQKGKNSFIFKDVQNTGGFKGYRVLIEAEGDTNNINNELSTFTNVIDKPNILIINGINGDSSELEKILENSGGNLTVIEGISSPRTLNEFLEFKTVVLNNVHSDDLNKGFMENLEAYVKDYGGGLVTFGGEDAYALGSYKDTVLEKVLPVDMDKKGENEVPSISLTLIIDKSGSMSSSGSGVSKLTLAKEAAMKAVDNLREIDEITVISFESIYDVVVERQKVTNKDDIKSLIAGISETGGTSIYPALEKGYEFQLESDAKIKHTILLTDGQDSVSQSEYNTLLDKFNENNITLSTVAVGSDSNSNLLNTLAEKGNGRNYYTDMYTDIPRIFAQEVMISAGTYIINEEFTPKILSNHEILSGVNTNEGIPSLLGYIGTSIKEDAIEILSSKRDEPILASRQYGLGKTVSFTSDIDGSWSRNYLSWDYGSQLIKNIVFSTLPQYGESGQLYISQSGNNAKIEFYDDNINENSTVTGIYNNENGESESFDLLQTEPGKYEAEVELESLGFYNFNIRETNLGEVINTYNGAFALQYSEEFKFNNNEEKLDIVVKETEGTFLEFSDEVFQESEEEQYKTIDITSILLTLAILFFMLDIMYRRLNLNFFKIKNLKEVKIKNPKNKVEEVKNQNKDEAKRRLNKLEKEKRTLNKNNKINSINKDINKDEINDTTIIKVDTKKQALDTNTLLKRKNDRNKY